MDLKIKNQIYNIIDTSINSFMLSGTPIYGSNFELPLIKQILQKNESITTKKK